MLTFHVVVDRIVTHNKSTAKDLKMTDSIRSKKIVELSAIEIEALRGDMSLAGFKGFMRLLTTDQLDALTELWDAKLVSMGVKEAND